MADLAKYIKPDTTLFQIDNNTKVSNPRPYLGMSQLGHGCTRYLWYQFRWCYTDKVHARIQRIFTVGHDTEPRIIKDLERIGIKCYGDQTEMTAGFGHIKGHCDGIGENIPEAPKTPHLLEFKTMNDKYFKHMWAKGCQVSKPIYWAQCQLYMHFLKLTRTLFICINKNDSSYYIERIRYNKEAALSLIKRGEDILFSEFAPPIISPRGPAWFECKWCSAKEVCFGREPVNKTCRTCEYIDIMNDGIWHCPIKKKDLSTKEQANPCDKYKLVQ